MKHVLQCGLSIFYAPSRGHDLRESAKCASKVKDSTCLTSAWQDREYLYFFFKSDRILKYLVIHEKLQLTGSLNLLKKVVFAVDIFSSSS